MKDAKELGEVEEAVEFAEGFSRKTPFEEFESYGEEHA